MLAYSGGLDTSVALRWLAEEYGAEVVALLVDVGQGVDRETVTQARAGRRRRRRRHRRRPRGVRARVRPADPSGRRPLRGPLSAGLGALAPADRPASRGGRPRGGRHGRRPRLHRQGQRPGAVRDRRGGARAGPRGPRPGPGLGHDARAGDRLRRAARHRGAREARRRVLDRPEPVGAVDRGRPARGSRGSRRPRRPTRSRSRRSGRSTRRRRSRSRSRQACPWPSTARSWAWSS